MTQATLCPTKAGHGYKIVVDDVWYYTSAEELVSMMKGEANACKFRSIDEWNQAPVPVIQA